MNAVLNKRKSGMDKPKTKGTPSDIDVHVGQRIRVKRSLMGISQEKLAEAVGITFQQIQKYERGTNRVSAGRLYEVSKILQVPVSYFFEQITDNSQTPPIQAGLSDNEQDGFASEQDVMMNKETLELVRTYYSIESPELRKDLMKFVKSMANKYKS